MNIEERTREELIAALHHLEKEHASLKSRYEQSIHEHKQAERVLQDLINKNPISIQIIDKDGYTLQANQAHTDLFGAVPPSDYSIFQDRQLIQQGFVDQIGNIKNGEVVHFPDFHYNVHDLHAKFPDKPIWIRMVVFPIIDKEGQAESYVLIHENITESKQKEFALHESEENYRLLLELAPMAFYQGDTKGNIIMSNKKATTITGYSNEELLQLSMKDLFSEAVLNQKPLRYDLLDKGEVVTIEREIICKDNTTKVVEMSSRKMPNSTYQAFMKDISERKKTELALRESEHLYRAIFENTGTSSIIIEEDSTIILTNTEWVNLTGYSREEMEGKMSWTQFVVPEDLTRMVEYHKSRRVDPEAAPQKYEFRFIRKNGEIRNMINCVGVIPESKRSIASLMDITELKQAEETLKENETKLKTIIETSPDGIAITSLEGTVQFVTQKVLSIWGYDSAEEVIGKNVMEFVHPDFHEKASHSITELINGVITGAEEYLMVSKDGSYFYGESNANILHDKNNSPIGILYVNRDVTQRKEAEYELIKAKEKAEESDRLKSAFLANMSHEIRTPMNGILGFADLLKEPQLSGEEQQEYIGIIEKSGARMLNIINNIIDIAKIESGEIKTIYSETNLNEQLDFIFNFFKPEAEKKGLSLSLKSGLTTDKATIITDREKLYAILTNLIKNAIKFTDKGSIEIGCNTEGKHLEFFVKDTGVGIPLDRHTAVFERFVQADIADRRAFQGAGLGLAITKAFVGLLGGKIWFESEEQKGSTFYFTIPNNCISKITPAEKHETTENSIQQVKSLKVLVAEDDDISDMYITKLLKKYNCELLLHAKTGVEAVKACRNNRDLDLILMDIKMPDMDGYEATRQIREFAKDVIIVAQSAYALSGDDEKALTAGCNDYIAKPVTNEALNKIIRTYFSK